MKIESVFNSGVGRNDCVVRLQRQQIGKRNRHRTEPTNEAKTETPAAPVNVNWFATAGCWNPPQWNAEPGTVNGRNYEKDRAYLQL